MVLPSVLSELSRLFKSSLVHNAVLRKRFIFEIKQNYFSDLEIRIPIGYDLTCPIDFVDAWWSFNEIFLAREYEPALAFIPAPKRWLDIGCHAGFFSLYLLHYLKRKQHDLDCQALLIDADIRVEKANHNLIALNGMTDKFRYLTGLICGADGSNAFLQSVVMSSTAASLSAEDTGLLVNVPRVKPEKILSLLPGPYDLIKVDIEGSEFDFIQYYHPVLQATSYLLMEWHSWHSGGGGREQLESSLHSRGFTVVKEVTVPTSAVRYGTPVQSGVLLFQRK